VITKDDVSKAFQKTIRALEKDESTNVLMALDDFQSLMLTLGSVKQDPVFFVVGDAMSTLSYHLRNMYSRFVPGIVPREIHENAVSRIRSTLENVRKSLCVLQEEMLKKEGIDYKAILDAIGEIYLRSYEIFKFGASYILPSELPSGES